MSESEYTKNHGTAHFILFFLKMWAIFFKVCVEFVTIL